MRRRRAHARLLLVRHGRRPSPAAPAAADVVPDGDRAAGGRGPVDREADGRGRLARVLPGHPHARRGGAAGEEGGRSRGEARARRSEARGRRASDRRGRGVERGAEVAPRSASRRGRHCCTSKEGTQ